MELSEYGHMKHKILAEAERLRAAYGEMCYDNIVVTISEGLFSELTKDYPNDWMSNTNGDMYIFGITVAVAHGSMNKLWFTVGIRTNIE